MLKVMRKAFGGRYSLSVTRMIQNLLSYHSQFLQNEWRETQVVPCTWGGLFLTIWSSKSSNLEADGDDFGNIMAPQKVCINPNACGL